LGKIYTEQDIAEMRKSPEFEREYNGRYIGQMGNVFSPESIERAIALGMEYEELRGGVNMIPMDTTKSMGVDAGFTSSAFGIVITQLTHGRAEVIYAEEYERPDIGDMIDLILDIKSKYGVQWLFIDAANVPVIRGLKKMLGEPTDYDTHIAKIRQRKQQLWQYMKILPISFNSDGREMLAHCRLVLDKEKVAIGPRYNKLLVALRTAQARRCCWIRRRHPMMTCLMLSDCQ
jgi:hypothetical protein